MHAGPTCTVWCPVTSILNHPVAQGRRMLLTLPDDTVVHTGHGDAMTIAAEASHVS